MSGFHSARRGMTLVELMIALVITGMTLAAGYAALTTIIDRRGAIDTAMNDVVYATAVRRTMIDWISHGHVTLALASGPNGLSQSTLGSTFGMDQGGDTLRFVTTAPTPLHRDSTTVVLQVNAASNPSSAFGMTSIVRGLSATLTPSTSAQREESQSAGAEGSSSGISSAMNGEGVGSDNAYSDSTTMVVTLDPRVTGLSVDYLVEAAGQQHWVTESDLVGLRGSGTMLRAVRLTLMSSGGAVLPAALQLPIVVPMQLAM